MFIISFYADLCFHQSVLAARRMCVFGDSEAADRFLESGREEVEMDGRAGDGESPFAFPLDISKGSEGLWTACLKQVYARGLDSKIRK